MGGRRGAGTSCRRPIPERRPAAPVRESLRMSTLLLLSNLLQGDDQRLRQFRHDARLVWQVLRILRVLCVLWPLGSKVKNQVLTCNSGERSTRPSFCRQSNTKVLANEGCSQLSLCATAPTRPKGFLPQGSSLMPFTSWVGAWPLTNRPALRAASRARAQRAPDVPPLTTGLPGRYSARWVSACPSRPAPQAPGAGRADAWKAGTHPETARAATRRGTFWWRI